MTKVPWKVARDEEESETSKNITYIYIYISMHGDDKNILEAVRNHELK